MAQTPGLYALIIVVFVVFWIILNFVRPRWLMDLCSSRRRQPKNTQRPLPRPAPDPLDQAETGEVLPPYAPPAPAPPPRYTTSDVNDKPSFWPWSSRSKAARRQGDAMGQTDIMGPMAHEPNRLVVAERAYGRNA